MNSHMSGVSWQGSLTKTGGGALKRDRERWFELRGAQLIYYNEKPLGVIDLPHTELTCDGERCTLTGAAMPRAYQFSASSPQKMEELTQCIAEAKDAARQDLASMPREDLEKVVGTLKGENRMLHSVVSDSTGTAGLTERLAAATTINAELQSQLAAMKKNVEASEADSVASERKARQQAERLSTELQNARDALVRAETLETRLAATQEELDQQRKTLQSVQNMSDDFKMRVSVLEGELSSATSAESESAEATRQLWTTIAEKTKQNDVLTRELEQCQATLRDRNTDMEDKHTEVTKLTQALSEARELGSTAREENLNMETLLENERKEGQLRSQEHAAQQSTLSTSLQNAEARVEGLLAEVRAVTNEMATTQEALEDATQTAAAVDNHGKEVQGELARTKEELLQMRTDAERTSTELSEAMEEIVVLRPKAAQAEELQHTANGLDADLQNLRSKLSTTEDAVTEMTASMNRAKADYTASEKELRETTQISLEREKEIESVNSDLAEARKVLAEKGGTVAEMEAKVNELIGERDALQRSVDELGDAAGAVEELTAQLNGKAAELAELEAEVVKVNEECEAVRAAQHRAEEVLDETRMTLADQEATSSATREELRSTLDARNADVERLSASLGAANQELLEKSETLTHLRDEIQQAETSLSNHKGQDQAIESARREVEVAEAALAAEKRATELLTEKVEKGEAEVRGAQAAVVEGRELNVSKVKELEATIKELEAELASSSSSLHATNEKFVERLAEAQAISAGLQETVSEVNGRHSEVQKLLSATQEKLDAADKQVEGLSESTTALNEKLAAQETVLAEERRVKTQLSADVEALKNDVTAAATAHEAAVAELKSVSDAKLQEATEVHAKQLESSQKLLEAAQAGSGELNETLTQEIAQLTASLAAETKKASDTQTDLQGKEGEVLKLNEKLAAQETVLAEERRASTQLSADVEALKNDVTAAATAHEAAVAELTSTHDAKLQEASEVHAKQLESSQQLSVQGSGELNEKIAELNSILAAETKKASDAQADLQGKQDELLALSQQLTTQEAARAASASTAEEALSTKNTELEELRHQVRELEDRAKTTAEGIGSSHEELNRQLSEAIQAASTHRTNEETLRDELKTVKQSFEGKVEELNKRVLSLVQGVNAGEAASDTLKELACAKEVILSELTGARTSLRTLEEVIECDLRRIKQLERGNALDAKDVERMQKDNKKLTSANAEMKKELQALNDKNSRQTTCDSSPYERFRDERDMWKRKLDKARAETDAARLEKDLNNVTINTLTTERDLLQAEAHARRVDLVVQDQMGQPARDPSDPTLMQNRVIQVYVDLKKALHDAKDSLKKVEHTIVIEAGRTTLDMVVERQVIKEVTPNGYAESAGLRVGMVIVCANNEPIQLISDVLAMLTTGDVSLTVQEPSEDAVLRFEGREVFISKIYTSGYFP